MIRARTVDLSWRAIDSEVVVLDEVTWEYLHLNESASALWLSVAEGTTRDALIAQLKASFSIDDALAARDVDAFLADVDQRGLLADPAETVAS